MYTSNLIKVEDIYVRKEIKETHFVCDLGKCKGACCTMESEYGAPLLSDEIEKIKNILPIVMEYLPEKHKRTIELNGFFSEKDDQLMTNSFENKACVFVYYEKDIAKCAIEKAFNEGKVDFQKPLSCHLFPIRVSNFGGEILRYEKYEECTPALKLGAEKQITVEKFCKDALVRKYSNSWYSLLKTSK